MIAIATLLYKANQNLLFSKDLNGNSLEIKHRLGAGDWLSSEVARLLEQLGSLFPLDTARSPCSLPFRSGSHRRGRELRKR